MHLIPVENVPIVRAVVRNPDGSRLYAVGVPRDDLLCVLDGQGLVVDVPELAGKVLLYGIDGPEAFTSSVTEYLKTREA